MLFREAKKNEEKNASASFCVGQSIAGVKEASVAKEAAAKADFEPECDDEGKASVGDHPWEEQCRLWRELELTEAKALKQGKDDVVSRLQTLLSLLWPPWP